MLHHQPATPSSTGADEVTYTLIFSDGGQERRHTLAEGATVIGRAATCRPIERERPIQGLMAPSGGTFSNRRTDSRNAADQGFADNRLDEHFAGLPRQRCWSDVLPAPAFAGIHDNLLDRV